MSLIGASCTKTGTPVSSADSKTSTLPTSSSSSSVVTKAAITYSTGEGYTLTGPASVDVGSDLTFTLAYAEGYAGGSVSASSGTLIDNKDGTYSIAGVTGDLTISVSGVSKITLSITYPTGDHFTLTGEKSVAFGSSYTFKVVFEAGYSGIVKVNGETVTLASDGSYMIPVVKANVLITVEGVDIATYPVSLPTGEGYTLTADKEVVKYGESLTLTFKVLASYSGGVVKVNGAALSFDSNGQATITNIVAPLTISVEGLIKTITLDYVSGTGYHFAGPATANLGDSVTFSIVYDAGYRGGTVKAGSTVLTANSDGTYTIAAIEDATRKVTLTGVIQTLAEAAIDFAGTDGDMTISDETSILDTEAGYLKSTKVVTPSTGGLSAFSAPRILPNVFLGQYSEVRFAIRSNGSCWWELQDVAGNDLTANVDAVWHEVKFVYEAGVYRLYAAPGDASNPTGWTSHTFTPDFNLMNLRMKIGASGTCYVSELVGAQSEEEFTNPYTAISDYPLSQAGTASTTELPPTTLATKSTHATFSWGFYNFNDLALTSYKDLLFYAKADGGNYYSGLCLKDSAGTSTLIGGDSSENTYVNGSWRITHLVLNEDGTTFTLYSDNYLITTKLAITNLNQLTFKLNGTYYISQLFGIAK